MAQHVFIEGLAAQQGNGLDTISALPGIYAVFNRHTGRTYVGSAINLLARCRGHISGLKRGLTLSGPMRRDLQLYGTAHFVCIALETFASLEEAGGQDGLGYSEVVWIRRLGTYREDVGYNSMLGVEWTKGARLRDRERKLIRSSRYFLLAGVDLYDPIESVLLQTWAPEPRVTER